MAPRPYALGKRASTSEETRRRILEAIVALHAERGIAVTTAVDVAARADVSVGTVTRYFPSLETMIDACGGRLREMVPPPQMAIFNGATTLDERIRVLVAHWFDFYDRLAPWLPWGYADAERVPALAESLGRLHAQRELLVNEALRPSRRTRRMATVAFTLTSYHTWRSFVDAGTTSREAAKLATGVLTAYARKSDSTQR